ncbi:MAG: hypothetical protein ACI9E5_000884 [Candidatus Omnitrophota bacterium]
MLLRLLSTISFIFLIATAGYGFRSLDASLQEGGSVLNRLEAEKLVVHPQDRNILYAMSEERLFISFNKGKDFEAIFNKSGVVDFCLNKETLFLVTDEGVYVSGLDVYNFERLFNLSSEEAPQSIVEYKGSIYLGTNKGLYRKEAFASRFILVKGELGRASVKDLVKSEDSLFVAVSNAVYQWGEEDNFTKSLTVGVEPEGDFELIKDIYARDTVVVVSTSKGVFVKAKGNVQWQLLSGVNVDHDTVTAIVNVEFVTPTNSLYRESSHGQCPMGSVEQCFAFLIGTSKGMYFHHEGVTSPVYEGIEGQYIYAAVYDNGHYYTLTNRGIFVLKKEALTNSLPVAPTMLSSQYLNFIKQEPTIADVHKWAIDQAEVHPDKIRQWRKLARKKALFPQINMGFDGGNDWGGSDSLWGSSSGALAIGPDDKSYGGDFGWDVGLSWDLGDFIWSTDQTTIDSRSKLMVELREDVLDQVTRLYFERRRLQLEILNRNADEYEYDLRVQELTAHLDAYTGGLFSKLEGKGDVKR